MSRYATTGRPWSREAVHGAFVVESTDCVDKRTGTVYRDGAYRVVDGRTGKPARRGKGGTVPFYGETAWSDALRLADDLYAAERWAR